MGPGDVVGGRFRVDSVAGQGGMAVVFRAHDERTHEPVAVKVMQRVSQVDLRRFQRETGLLRTLDHPGIVRLLDHGCLEDGAPYLVMEWLEGEDLAVRLARGALDVKDAVVLGERVASALGAAHGRGIVHRDVKPSNILLVGGKVEDARLIDFGIAYDQAAAGVTTTGLIVGTPGYMSPEQARGVREIDSRADVFALGCVLYECLAGVAPFVGDHPVAILAKSLMAEPARVGIVRSGVPAGLDGLIARMLAKAPDARPADGAAVAEALRTLSPGDDRVCRPSTIGEHEQQVVSLVLALAPEGDVGHAATLAQGERDVLTTRVSRAVVALGASLEVMVGGSIIALVRADSPTDKAARAARCALAVRRLLPGHAVVVATGRAILSHGVPMGRVIDAAAALARRVTGRRAVVVDDTTRALLDARFEISGDELVRERTGGGTRTVLGRPTALVGRARELGMLTRLFEEALTEGTPRAVVVTGVAGQGKTRLAEELGRTALGLDARTRTWVARADALAMGSAFGLAAQLVRAAVADGGAESEPGWARVRDHVAVRMPDNASAADFLAELVRAPPPLPGVHLTSARADARLMGHQMTRAFVDLALAEGSVGPLLVVVDDLQWGDLPSVKLLDAVLRVESRLPLLVVGLARPEVDETFPSLWSERGVTRLSLGALPRKASLQLVHLVLGADADAAMVARVVDAADGNPFMLEELLRAAPHARGSVPDTVLAMALRRLEAFDADTRQVLRAASVFGPHFWRGGVLGLVGEAKAGAVDVALDTLAHAEVVAPVASSKLAGERELEFRHAIVRDAAYAMLSDADRELGHRLAATWLFAKGETDPVVLATHAERGGDRAIAAEWWVVAGEQALGGSDLRAATERAERAIVREATPASRGAARRVQAEAAFWEGDQEVARRRGNEAMELLERGSRPWFEAALFALSAASQLGDADGTLGLVETVRTTAAEPGAHVTKVQALAVGAGYLVFQGRTDTSEAVLGEIEADASALAAEHPGTLARFTVSRTILAYVRGDLGTYVEGTRRAAQLFFAAGDQRRELGQRANLVHALVESGAYASAVSVGRSVEQGASALGVPHTVALARQNLGLALAALGSYDEAERVQRAALDEFARGGHKRLEGASQIYLALGSLATAALDVSEEQVRRAVGVLSASPPLLPYALSVRAEIALRRGDAARARVDAVEAMKLIDQLGGEGEGLTNVLLSAAETALAVGDRAAAAEAAERGVLRVRARAATLKDPELWESFSKVRENVRLLEIASLAGGPGARHH